MRFIFSNYKTLDLLNQKSNLESILNIVVINTLFIIPTRIFFNAKIKQTISQPIRISTRWIQKWITSLSFFTKHILRVTISTRCSSGFRSTTVFIATSVNKNRASSHSFWKCLICKKTTFVYGSTIICWPFTFWAVTKWDIL